MPPAGASDEARLIVDRAGERAAPVAEQLAVGELARRRRAVVREEHAAGARRSEVDGAGHEFLAGAAFAGHQHGQVVALQPLDLFDDTVHRRARADEAGQDRVERPQRRLLGRLADAVARAAQREALPRDGGDHPQAAAGHLRHRAGRRRRWRSAGRRPRGRAARRSTRRQPYAAPRSAERARVRPASVSQPAVARTRRSSPGERRTSARGVGVRRFERAPTAVSSASRSAITAASTSRRTMTSSASPGDARYSPVVSAGSWRDAGARLRDVRLRAERLEDGERFLAGDARPRSGRRRARPGVRARGGSGRPGSARRAGRRRSRSARGRDTRRSSRPRRRCVSARSRR